jgi:hypothetical protein
VNSISTQLAFTLVVKLAAFMLLVSNFEILVNVRQLSDAGLMSWKVGRLRSAWLTNRHVEHVLGLVVRHPNVIVLIGFRLLAAGWILVGPLDLITNPLLLGLIFASGIILFVRNSYGYDGADQMNWIVFGGLLLVSVEPTIYVKSVFLWFVAGQACLSYGVAGFAKALSEGWRDGRYLAGIMGTRIYGHPMIADLLRDHQVRAKCMSWAIIIWECSFPLVLLLPFSFAVVVITLGVCFHLFNAYVMGLNTFVWSFVATYPAILFCVSARG